MRETKGKEWRCEVTILAGRDPRRFQLLCKTRAFGEHDEEHVTCNVTPSIVLTLHIFGIVLRTHFIIREVLPPGLMRGSPAFHPCGRSKWAILLLGAATCFTIVTDYRR